MTLLNSIPPGLILILGAIVLLLLPATARKAGAIGLAALGFFAISQLETGERLSPSFLGFDLTLTSKAFGYIFTLCAVAAFIFSWHEKRRAENTAALVYIGSALGVVFAGDMITWYVCWELMAIASTFLVLARKTEKSLKAAQRYILVHLAGGLILLTGILLTVHQTGEIAFIEFPKGEIGSWLILIGILINAAAVPFSSWLPDAYPESTVMGGVILSAYTTKTAVYTLIRGFPGWEILVAVGCVMTIYGIIYALLENDMRRILAYSIINQVGFMVCGVGIGTELAIAGVVAHAFCHIIYKALLWMSAGAVLFRTGKSKCTELGGLYKTMPLTMILGTIGALSISSVPLTSGFVSKTLIVAAAEQQHYLWVWLVLEIASAGVFLHAGIKFPYFVFFNVDRGLRPKEAPKPMLIGMGLLAFLCIYLGCHPTPLYDILPFDPGESKTFSAIYVDHFANVVTMFQLLAFSALAFFVFLPLLKRTPTISIDFDWFYRKGAKWFFWMADKSLNSLNAAADKYVIKTFLPALTRFALVAPAALTAMVLKPVWRAMDPDEARLTKRRDELVAKFTTGTFPIAYSAACVLIILSLLVLIGRTAD